MVMPAAYVRVPILSLRSLRRTLGSQSERTQVEHEMADPERVFEECHRARCGPALARVRRDQNGRQRASASRCCAHGVTSDLQNWGVLVAAYPLVGPDLATGRFEPRGRLRVAQVSSLLDARIAEVTTHSVVNLALLSLLQAYRNLAHCWRRTVVYSTANAPRACPRPIMLRENAALGARGFKWMCCATSALLIVVHVRMRSA